MIRQEFYYRIDNLICAVCNTCILMCNKNLVEMKIMIEMKKEKRKQSRQKRTAAKIRLPESYIVYLQGPLLLTQKLPITIL